MGELAKIAYRGAMANRRGDSQEVRICSTCIEPMLLIFRLGPMSYASAPSSIERRQAAESRMGLVDALPRRQYERKIF